jgi:hypothetical protein
VAGDEVVFGKASKETYGIERFFSSLQNRVIPDLSFFVFSVIHVKARQSYPIQAVQMVKSCPESVEVKSKKKAVKKEKRPVGRPKGSKNKKSEKPILSLIIADTTSFAGVFGNFERSFVCTVSRDGRSFWKLPQCMDGVTNWTAIRFKTSLGCGSI